VAGDGAEGKLQELDSALIMQVPSTPASRTEAQFLKLRKHM
jgi:hypothetical protein